MTEQPSPYEFVFPQRLVKDVVPRPGGVTVPQPPFAKGAADQWRAWLDEARPTVDELLAAPRTDPSLAAAARDQSSAAWAALALHLAVPAPPPAWQPQRLAPWIDPAVAALGPVAAAQVAVWFACTGVLVEKLAHRDGSAGNLDDLADEASVEVAGVDTIFFGAGAYKGPGTRGTSHQRQYFSRTPHSPGTMVVATRTAGFVHAAPDWNLDALHRLRLRLSESGWEGVADALEPLRDLGETACLVISILVPQRRDWFAAAVDTETRPALYGDSEKLVCVASLDDLMAFSGPPPRRLVAQGRFGLYGHIPWPTLLDAVGVGLAEFIEAAVESESLDQSALPVDLLAEIPTQTAFRVLFDAADVNREAAAAAVGHALRWPRVAAPLLAASAETDARSRTLLGMMSLDDLAEHPDEFTAQPWATVKAHAKAPDGPLADAAAVPGLLAALPWDDRPKVSVLRLTTPSTGVETHWLPGEREAWAAQAERHFARRSRPGAWLHTSSSAPPLTYDDADRAAQLALVLAEGSSWWAVRPFVSRDIVGKMAEWASGKKKNARDEARSYLRRHAGPASRLLIPVAFGKPKKAQQTALSALLMLQASGHGDAVAEAAATFGEVAEQTWRTMVGAGPAVLGLPAQVPVRPGWLAVRALPQVQLSGGAGALPTGAVENLVTMLAISTLDAPYVGLDVVRESCTPASTATFVWGLFEQWQLVGYPASEGWVLDALGLFGDDETARRLAPLVRAWPGESAHQRAVKGLDVLVGIGTDVALMQLHAIAQKVKFKGIKDQARARIDALAEQRGLTAAQLSDRLVPDLGLGADGTMVLDFGDKSFTVGFDEHLRPTVTDDQGQPRKSLPRSTSEPGASSAKTFSGLKKDVRVVADLQLRRLEEAMVTQRGWTVEEFVTYLVDHPLVWHLTRRLVWRCDNGFFRVAEDKTFADADDEAFTPQGTVRLAHQLNLGDQASRWASLLADYEILQPFLQVGRDTYTADQVAGLDGATVPSGKVLGLEKRGWRRGSAEDHGCQLSIDRLLLDGTVWELGLDPGFLVDTPMAYEEQTIHPADLTGLDAITCSEILRDLHTLQG